MPDQDTATLQHWMKTVITSYGRLGHKLQEAQKRYGFQAQDVVQENEIESVSTRLSVYTNGYVLRLLECMSADYPVLKQYAGDASFDNFATAYLLWKPSVSFTLYDLGKSFPEFLEKTRPQLPDATEEQHILLQLPAALALLERALQEAILGAGTEQDSHPIQIGIEDIFFHGLTVVTPPCLRLLSLPFPIVPVYKALQEEAPYELPIPRPTFMAVSRKNYHLVMDELAAWQYTFLSHCNAPIILLSAVTLTADSCGIAADALLADLYIWLPVLQQQGFITVSK